MPRFAERTLSRLTGRTWLSPRFDPMFRDGPSVAWIRRNLQAHSRFHRVTPESLTNVGIFSFSRGGSHLLESQFHYAKNCFCFGEGSIDFLIDVNWRTFLCRGMFNTDSIQDKMGDEVSHLFFNCNNSPVHLDRPYWDPNEHITATRKWILVLRNPLRILLSQSDTGKGKWKLTEARILSFLSWYRKSCCFFLQLLQTRPEDCCVVSIENFAAAPTATLVTIAAQVGVDQGAITDRPSPEQFFQQVGRTGEKPVVRNGYLASPTRDIIITGWGGDFNPITPIDERKLFRHNLPTSFSSHELSIIKSEIGRDLLEFYMSDENHRFVGATAQEVLTMWAEHDGPLHS